MVLLSRLSNFQLENRTVLKAMFDNILTEIEGNATDVASQLATINALLNPDILDPIEKAELVREVTAIQNEKSGLNTQATTLGITTENTTYNNAYTTLINYLNGLSPAYSDTTQNTVISRTTFNSNFQSFYTARQALKNKMDDVASAQSVVINPFADVTIYADSAGTVKSGQLPKNVAITASKGASAVTTLGTWSRTATTGITCTIGASTGILNITAMSGTDVSVPISFSYLGVTRTATVRVIKQNDPPSNSGGSGATGGTSASTTTLGNTTGTAYDTTNAVSATLTATAGSNGQVQCTAPISFNRTNTTNPGETGAYGKWQWRAIAGSWADITTEVQESFTAVAVDDPELGFINGGGSISVTQTKTGLTNGTSYEFRFLWRQRNVSGTASAISRTSGTLEAVGS